MADFKEFIVVTSEGLTRHLERLAVALVNGDIVDIEFVDDQCRRTIPFVPINIDNGDPERVIINGLIIDSDTVAYLHTEGNSLVLTTDH